MHSNGCWVLQGPKRLLNCRLLGLHGNGDPQIQKRRIIAVNYRNSTLPLESSDSPFASQDPLQHQAAIDFYTQAYRLQRIKQQHVLHRPQFHISLPDSREVAKYCPLLATAMLLPAGALLMAPQQTLQLLAGALASPTAAVDALGTCFGRLMGASYLFEALVTVMAWGCVSRGELGTTTCQRMLMATLLPVPGILLALNKAAASCTTAMGMASLAVIELGMFAVHVLLHLHHHPWFLVKVFWPLATTMLITELIPTDWTPSDTGTGPFQAVLAALLSVKLVGRLSSVAAKAAPRVAKRWLLPVVTWLAKHALPRLTARLAKVLPRLARYIGRLIPRLTRLGARLAGRMAPRYAQDQLAGHTQQWAFPDADGLLTDTVAKCIDMLPPKNPASCTYVGLLLLQLMMVIGAYAPDLLFTTTAAAAGSAAASEPAGIAVAAPVITAAAAEGTAALTGTAAALAAVLRFVKFSWGAGYFVSAFACNCLKTAADRGHLWKPANRQLNLALALLQAGTAIILLSGIETGAVVSNTFAWVQIAAAVAGAMFCLTQAAAAGMQQQQLFSLVGVAAGSCTPAGSTTGTAIGSIQQDSSFATVSSTTASVGSQGLVTGTAAGGLNGEQQQAILEAAITQLAHEQLSSMPNTLLSSVDWESKERGDPHYAAVMSATCVLLTLLQLAL